MASKSPVLLRLMEDIDSATEAKLRSHGFKVRRGFSGPTIGAKGGIFVRVGGLWFIGIWITVGIALIAVTNSFAYSIPMAGWLFGLCTALTLFPLLECVLNRTHLTMGEREIRLSFHPLHLWRDRLFDLADTWTFACRKRVSTYKGSETYSYDLTAVTRKGEFTILKASSDAEPVECLAEALKQLLPARDE